MSEISNRLAETRQAKLDSLPHRRAELAGLLRNAMRDRGLTHQALAADVGVSLSAVQAWTSGRGLPKLVHLLPLSRSTGVPLGTLCRVVDRPSDPVILERFLSGPSTSLPIVLARWMRDRQVTTAMLARDLGVGMNFVSTVLQGTCPLGPNMLTPLHELTGIPLNTLAAGGRSTASRRGTRDMQAAARTQPLPTAIREARTMHANRALGVGPRFGTNVRDARHQACATISTSVGVTPRVLRGWEDGTSTPSVWALHRLARCVGVPDARLVRHLGVSDSQAAALAAADHVESPVPFHVQLNQLMTERGVTGYQLARACETAASNVSRWRNGLQAPSWDNLCTISEFLDADLTLLLSAHPEHAAVSRAA